MIENKKEFAFVLDGNGKQLDPTVIQNAWRLIRKQKAVLVSKFPMVIKLHKCINKVNDDEIHMGIDDGSKFVGIALVQKCKTKNKLLFLGTIQQRKDVHKLMVERKEYRMYRRKFKHYREQRFNNRASSKRSGRLPPTIKQKKQSILRVIDRLLKYIKINVYHLENTKFDIRVLIDGYKPKNYTKSNRLDENLRVATILRDKCCVECGIKNVRFEVHHITPKSKGGNDTIKNLVTLCPQCHQKTFGKESEFADKYYKITNGKKVFIEDAMHVMQGKKYLQDEISKRGILVLTNGANTANTRIEWNIEKSHDLDAYCCCELKCNKTNLITYIIKPMRKKSRKKKTNSVLGFKHRDFVEYTYRNGETYQGYITALNWKRNAISFRSLYKVFTWK